MYQTSQFVLSMMLLLTILTGCGASSTDQSSKSDNRKYYSELDELKKELELQVVICTERMSDCPESIAKLAFWGKSDSSYYMSVCSGNLYKEEFIITNAHCIPDEVKKAGSVCSDQIKVLFPSTQNKSAEAAHCSRIIQVFDEENNVDLAVFKLNRLVKRSGVEIKKGGFKEGAAVHAYVMNPAGSYAGGISKKSCNLSVANLMTLGQSANNATALLSGEHCDVIGGNSGSGLFSEDGKMIGLIFARIDRSVLREIAATNLLNTEYFTSMGLAVNIGCLNQIIENSASNCEKVEPESADLNRYIQDEISKLRLEGVSEDCIKYIISRELKLKLSNDLSLSFSITNSLQYFRKKWGSLFFGSKERKLAKVLH